MKERFNIGKTLIIDFEKQWSLTDPKVANACVEVMTSDGKTGTLSHLSIGNSSRLFAEDLRTLIGKDGVPVCLVGGFELSKESRNLVYGLFSFLEEAGFIVSNDREYSDVLGLWGRQSTLFSDKVIVHRKFDGKIDPIQLSFPS